MPLLTKIAKGLEALEHKIDYASHLLRARKFVARHPGPYRLNIGCGAVHFDGWVNVDLNPRPAVDLVWDITNTLPFPDDSCEFIYNEHFMEHLRLQDAVGFMRECYRVLQPGGVLRVGMPSVAESVRCYYENDWRNQPWLEKYGYNWIQTRAESINISFRHWGHQWLYDDEELTRRMKEAGFTDIRTVAWGESVYPELSQRETRRETRVICEARKEPSSRG